MPNEDNVSVDFEVYTVINSIEVKPNDFIEFNYTNYRDETRARQCHVVRFIYGTTPHHPEPGWFIIGEDPQKGYRTFSLKDMRLVRVLYKARN